MSTNNQIQEAVREFARAIVKANHPELDPRDRVAAVVHTTNQCQPGTTLYMLIEKVTQQAVAGEEPLRVYNPDGYGIATSDDLPGIWAFLNEMCRREFRERLEPLHRMGSYEKDLAAHGPRRRSVDRRR